MNISCAICSDLFMPSHDMYMTPCGHSFHHKCLTQWFERSKTCPQCRNKCTKTNIIKIYFNIVTNLDATLDTGTLLQKVDNLELQNRETNTKIKKLEEEQQKLNNDKKKLSKTVDDLKNESKNKDFLIKTYKEEVGVLQNDRKLASKLTIENKALQEKVHLMTTIETVIKATAKETEQMLNNNPDITTLVVMVGSLKRELKQVDVKKNEFRDMWKMCQTDCQVANQKIRELEAKCRRLETENTKLEQKEKSIFSANLNKALVYDSDESLSRTPEILKRSRTEDLNLSTPMAEKVEKILNADSPYLNIKESNILKTLAKSKARQGLVPWPVPNNQPTTSVGKTQSDLTDRISIFKKPRLASLVPNPNKLFNGLGGENISPPLEVLPNRDLKAKLKIDKLKLKKFGNGHYPVRANIMDMTTQLSPINRVIELE